MSEMFHTFTRGGIVQKTNTWAETHVGTSGGGTTYHSDGSSTTAPVNVTSTVTKKLEMFILDQDGEEFDLTLSDPTVGVREGHEVHVLCANTIKVWKKTKLAHQIAIHNLSTGKHSVDHAQIRQLSGNMWFVIIAGIFISGFLGFFGIKALLISLETHFGLDTILFAPVALWLGLLGPMNAIFRALPVIAAKRKVLNEAVELFLKSDAALRQG